MATEDVQGTAVTHSPAPLRREAIVPSSDTGRLAAIVATCSLAGLAGGMALSMLAETHRAARQMSASSRAHHGHVHAGPITWLGVRVVDAERGACTGALVKSVTEGGPADRVGFHTGDVVVGYGSERVCGNDHLIHIVRASSIGATADVRVRRGAEEVVLQPTLTAMPRHIRARLSPDELP